MRELSATTTIHGLRFGMPLCGFTKNAPADWPEGHVWVGLEEMHEINCAACRAEARKAVQPTPQQKR